MSKSKDEWSFNRVDLDKLDVEWNNQPHIYGQWARIQAKKKRRVAEMEVKSKVLAAELKRVSAELDQKIRSQPGKFRMKRITDTAIKETILLQPAYQKAQNRVFRYERRIVRAKYAADMAEAACRTLYQRKEELENQVRIMLAEQNATPRATRASHEEMRENAKRTLNRKLQRGEKK